MKELKTKKINTVGEYLYSSLQKIEQMTDGVLWVAFFGF